MVQKLYPGPRCTLLFCPCCVVYSLLISPFPFPPHIVMVSVPGSLWGWQDVIKAVFSEKVVVLATYGDRSIRSPSVVVQLPSVIALKVRVGVIVYSS